MIYFIIRLSFLAICGTSLAAHANIAIPPPAKISVLPDNMETRPVQLAKLASTLPRGTIIGKTKLGLLCLPGGSVIWKGRRGEFSTEDFDDAFRDELKQLGYDVVSTGGDLFDNDGDARAEFLVGGTITTLSVDACHPHSGLGDSTSAKGTALLGVEWQIYDRINRVVVARVKTRQGYKQARADGEGINGIVRMAFAQNVRALAASGELQKYLVGGRRASNLSRKPSADLPPLPMTLPSRGVANLTNAVGSTVLVESGAGHGSGFLISREGYFMTNYHVVGGAKYVKLRWADGLEELGEVLRVDKGRDVALVKGEARDRAPLRLLPAAPEVGAEVYAIGAPIEERLQNSVTRGIVSARRIEDGYSFIQSDVAVNPGNSGGPLVDARGDVVAITVSSLRIGAAPSGINFFIPAHEAIEFLGIAAK